MGEPSPRNVTYPHPTVNNVLLVYLRIINRPVSSLADYSKAVSAPTSIQSHQATQPTSQGPAAHPTSSPHTTPNPQSQHNETQYTTKPTPKSTTTNQYKHSNPKYKQPKHRNQKSNLHPQSTQSNTATYNQDQQRPTPHTHHPKSPQHTNT